jgi:hypothetical protein
MTALQVCPQFCSLGPLPPRTPARPDPQVPREPNLGPARWGKIGALYFYLSASGDDPAFGLFDIELSLQRLGDRKLRVDLYAIADGYQRGGASGADNPLEIMLWVNQRCIARFVWIFPDILDGTADPVTMSRDLESASSDWAAIDRIGIAVAS